MAVISMKTDQKNRVYHKDGCMYVKRMKSENRRMISIKKAQALHYHECKCCSGLKGDVKIHKKGIVEWERKAKNKAERRLAYLFATIEQKNPELVSYSLC